MSVGFSFTFDIGIELSYVRYLQHKGIGYNDTELKFLRMKQLKNDK